MIIFLFSVIFSAFLLMSSFVGMIQYSKIFDPYFTIKRQAFGTGICLYIAKTIVENEFNGAIATYNKMECAYFTLYFK